VHARNSHTSRPPVVRGAQSAFPSALAAASWKVTTPSTFAAKSGILSAMHSGRWLGLIAGVFVQLTGACSGGGDAANTQAAGAGGSATSGTSSGGTAAGTAGTAPATSGGQPTAGSAGAGGALGGGGSVSAGSGGSAAGTAGNAAGGTPTGMGIGGPSRCADADVALCEDFEAGLDAATWSTTKNGDASVVVDELHAARGTKALHVKSTAGNGFAYITEKKSFPATDNILYGRMFVWFEDDITTSGHFSLAEAAGSGDGTKSRFGGQNQVFGVGTDGGGSGDWTDKDNKKLPSKTWICAEFELKGDSNEFRVWWDDMERTALNRGATQHSGFKMPMFNSLWFGWWMYNMTEPQELWIDEIAVDFKPIGCSR
jgi:hypothetical protein